VFTARTPFDVNYKILAIYGNFRQTNREVNVKQRRCGTMKLLKRIFGFTESPKPLHFTDSNEYFEGVEFDAYERGELSF
jgi:hypothetical protein